jgi:hypothetical protein
MIDCFQARQQFVKLSKQNIYFSIAGILLTVLGGWLFGLVWTILYLLYSYSWYKAPENLNWLFTLNIILNVLWCFFFFGISKWDIALAVLIALDRMEKSGTATEIGSQSAVQTVEKEFGLPVIAIANLADLMAFLTASSDAGLTNYLPAVKAYREQYGI